MSVIGLIAFLVVVGLVLYLVNQFIPMDAKIKQILNIVVVILIIVLVISVILRVLGVDLGSLTI